MGEGRELGGGEGRELGGGGVRIGGGGMSTPNTCRPQLQDTGFVSERHQFKVFSSLVCYYNFLYMKFLFNYIMLSYF